MKKCVFNFFGQTIPSEGGHTFNYNKSYTNTQKKSNWHHHDSCWNKRHNTWIHETGQQCYWKPSCHGLPDIWSTLASCDFFLRVQWAILFSQLAITQIKRKNWSKCAEHCKTITSDSEYLNLLKTKGNRLQNWSNKKPF